MFLIRVVVWSRPFVDHRLPFFNRLTRGPSTLLPPSHLPFIYTFPQDVVVRFMVISTHAPPQPLNYPFKGCELGIPRIVEVIKLGSPRLSLTLSPRVPP